MLIRTTSEIPSSEITPKETFLNRRRFMAAAAAAGVAAMAGDRLLRMTDPRRVAAAEKLETVKSPLSLTGETLTSYQDITHYNNFYEFGVEKGDPAKYAGW